MHLQCFKSEMLETGLFMFFMPSISWCFQPPKSGFSSKQMNLKTTAVDSLWRGKEAVPKCWGSTVSVITGIWPVFGQSWLAGTVRFFFPVWSVNNQQCHQNSRRLFVQKLLADVSSCTCPREECVLSVTGRSDWEKNSPANGYILHPKQCSGLFRINRLGSYNKQQWSQ